MGKTKDLIKKVVTVEVVGKFGPKIKFDDYEGWASPQKPLSKDDFVKGASYGVELEEWKEGRYNIISAKLVGDAPKVVANSTVSKNQKDYADGQREGNIRNVSATLTQGLIMHAGLSKEEAYDAYKYFHDRLVADDAE